MPKVKKEHGCDSLIKNKKKDLLSKCAEVDNASASCSSPNREVGSKYHATPMKTRSKTFKSEAGEDVHTAVSPVTPKSRLSRSKNTSPIAPSPTNMYYLGACSQELPDVVYDFNSPKNSNRNYQRLKSLTIRGFSKNIQHGEQENDNGSQTLAVDGFLESMVKNKSPIALKIPYRSRPKGQKKNLHALKEELRKNFLLIHKPEGNNIGLINNCRQSDAYKQNIDLLSTSSHRGFKREETTSSLDEDGNDLDSEDELWGMNNPKDDEVVVQATQEMEACLISNGMPLTRVIPETYRETQFSVTGSLIAKQNSDIHQRLRSCTQAIASKPPNIPNTIPEESLPEDCVSDLTEWDWESDCEDIEWTDDLTVIDALSQVPDDVLQGCDNSAVSTKLPVDTTVSEISNKSDFHKAPNETIAFDISIHPQDRSKKVVAPIKTPVCNASESVSSVEHTMNYYQTLLETDTDIFNDVSLFNETVETTASSSSSRPMCTPQEIAMKKEEALRKRKMREKQKSRS